ncbi:putative transcription factor C2H2 family [Dioscorea sansibarensis]
MALLNSGAGAGGQKPLCSICYEDLKPIIEDLQSISLCGHVFHELWKLSRKSSECLKLDERNLMLAKELAALKLVDRT